MGASDIAKEALRIAGAAGLSKDVIDLLKEKITLLDEKVASLTRENSDLKAENYDLHKQAEVLQQQIGGQGTRPDGFDDTTDRIARLLFDHSDGASIEWIAGQVGVQQGVAEYHFDLLSNAGFIQQLAFGIVTDSGSSSGTFCLSSKGRKYVVKDLR